jgi:hypothetical protein
MVIQMEKTKIFILTTTLAILVVVAIAGAAYAQTLNQQGYTNNPRGNSQVPQSGSSIGANGAYGYGGYNCPGIGGAYTYGAPQNGYSYGMGMRGGMMGGYR